MACQPLVKLVAASFPQIVILNPLAYDRLLFSILLSFFEPIVVLKPIRQGPSRIRLCTPTEFCRTDWGISQKIQEGIVQHAEADNSKVLWQPWAWREEGEVTGTQCCLERAVTSGRDTASPRPAHGACHSSSSLALVQASWGTEQEEEKWLPRGGR